MLCGTCGGASFYGGEQESPILHVEFCALDTATEPTMIAMRESLAPLLCKGLTCLPRHRRGRLHCCQWPKVPPFPMGVQRLHTYRTLLFRSEGVRGSSMSSLPPSRRRGIQSSALCPILPLCVMSVFALSEMLSVGVVVSTLSASGGCSRLAVRGVPRRVACAQIEPGCGPPGASAECGLAAAVASATNRHGSVLSKVSENMNRPSE